MLTTGRSGPCRVVRFAQPGASSIVLNRVVGQDPSQIFGSLSSNGQVFLLNPNGILFGAGAQVSVGGRVASTLNMSDQDFMAGRHTLTRGAGPVAAAGGRGGGAAEPARPRPARWAVTRAPATAARAEAVGGGAGAGSVGEGRAVALPALGPPRTPVPGPGWRSSRWRTPGR